ncbi:hypothetical protein BC828DRAFT_378299 [Blastocladiella britannica]|nr:hypothetical protein BC828DRAFT_378299 [Blastocladiella britannica]
MTAVRRGLVEPPQLGEHCLSALQVPAECPQETAAHRATIRTEAGLCGLDVRAAGQEAPQLVAGLRRIARVVGLAPPILGRVRQQVALVPDRLCTDVRRLISWSSASPAVELRLAELVWRDEPEAGLEAIGDDAVAENHLAPARALAHHDRSHDQALAGTTAFGDHPSRRQS